MPTGILLPKNKEISIKKSQKPKEYTQKKPKGQKAEQDPKSRGVFDKISPEKYASNTRDKLKKDLERKDARYGEKTQKEGEGEAHKDIIKETEKQQELLDDVLKKSKKILLHAKSEFPFDFFPDEITIDPTKVIIVHKEFFGSGTMDTVYIKDIADVIVEAGPYLATINIVDVSYGASKHYIKKLKKKNAFKAREIIEGLVTALKAGIDIMKLPGNELLPSISSLSGMQKIGIP